MGKETSSEGAGGKEDATKGGWHVQLSLQIRNKLISAELSQDVLSTRCPSRYKYINGSSLHIY